MRWHYLLIDNDNTLMDFHLAEARALAETLAVFDLPRDEAVTRTYHGINDALWKALERGETTQAKLKVERFRQLAAAENWTTPGEALAETYQARLSQHGETLPGAVELLKNLQGKIKICLLTNGVSAIQRGRLSVCGFAHLLDAVIISEELGISKPDPRMAEAGLNALGCTDRRQAVLVGDSLTADIACAKAAGLDHIWYNPRHQSGAAQYRADSMEALRALLLEEA